MADIWDAVWVRVNDTIYMNQGENPYQTFTSKLPAAVGIGNAAWQTLWGSNRSHWPFNTDCCAYQHQRGSCASLVPSASCVAAVKAVCPSGTVDCKECLQVHSNSLHACATFGDLQRVQSWFCSTSFAPSQTSRASAADPSRLPPQNLVETPVSVS